MTWDLLLQWMTHLGEGSWEGFRDAIERLAPDDQDSGGLLRRLRLELSDMGHADFFVEGTRRWRVVPPVLAGLAMRHEVAVLCGGRTPQLRAALAAAAEAEGCLLSVEESADGPTVVGIAGDPAAIARAASRAALRFVPNYASALCRRLTPVYQLLERAPEESPPTNWLLKCFDFASMSLVEQLLPNAACECTPRRGLPRWYVHTRRGRLRPLPKREAIYAAAMLRHMTLLRYDAAARRLFVPVKAQLPELFSRAACLCAGRRGRVEANAVVFEEVPPATAAALCVAAGQRHPAAEWALRGFKAGDLHGQSV